MTPRIHIDIAPDVHGGVHPAELLRYGLRADQVIDFSANLNPYAPSLAVRQAIQQATIDCYPDPDCGTLRHVLALRHDVDNARILVGNGSSELIWLTAVAFLRPGDTALVLGPTYSSYQRVAHMLGANVACCTAAADDAFVPPLDAFRCAVQKCPPTIAFLANPNNPTGQVIQQEHIVTLASEAPHTLFVVDEAYADCQDAEQQTRWFWPTNVVRLRSLTKAHSLAGLRLGYAIGAAPVIAALRAAQPTWSVNALAQAAGLAALSNDTYLRDSLTRWVTAKRELTARLTARGFTPLPSTAPFFLLRVGNAERTRALLLRGGVVVRDCTSFGLPQYIRICARSPEDNARLLAALEEAR